MLPSGGIIPGANTNMIDDVVMSSSSSCSSVIMKRRCDTINHNKRKRQCGCCCRNLRKKNNQRYPLWSVIMIVLLLLLSCFSTISTAAVMPSLFQKKKKTNFITKTIQTQVSNAKESISNAKVNVKQSITNVKDKAKELQKSPNTAQALYTMQNLLAGVASAVALIPEASTFAITAGLHPLVGLGSTVILATFSGCFGGRPGLVSGASATVSLILAPLVQREGHLVMSLAVLLAGLFQIGLGLCQSGKYIRMVPHPVMLGFVNGLAVKVVRAQIPHFQHPHGVWLQGKALKWHSILVLLSAIVIDLLPKVTNLIPSPLAALALATIAANTLHLPIPRLVDIVGPEAFTGGLDTLQRALFPLQQQQQISSQSTTSLLSSLLPPYGQMLSSLSKTSVGAIVSTAVELAVVGLLQSLLTLQIIDSVTHTRGNTSRECVAQGMGNLVSGLLGGMGGSALLGQSLVNVNSGGTDRSSSISVAVFVLLGMTFCAPYLGQIPVAALVGLMLTIAEHTFSWDTLYQIWNGKVPKTDLIIIVAVAAVTVLQNIAAAVGIGVLASALRFAWQASCNMSAKVKQSSVVVSSAATTQQQQAGGGGGGSGSQLSSGSGPRRTVTLNGPLFFGSTGAFSTLCAPTNIDREVAKEHRDRLAKKHAKQLRKQKRRRGKDKTTPPPPPPKKVLAVEQTNINTGREVVIDFINSQVWDHSAIVAIDTLVRQYHELGITLYLRHLSSDCRSLLLRYSDIIASNPNMIILEVDTANDPIYQVGEDISLNNKNQ